MDREFAEGKITEKDLEDQHLSIRGKSKDPKEIGQIFLHLSEALASRRQKKNPDQIIKYSRLALQQPLETLEISRANILLGDGLNLKNQGLNGKAWAEKRHEVVEPYLHALKIILDNLKISSRQPLKSVGRFSCPDSSQCKEAEEVRRKLLSERSEADKQNKLLERRDVLMELCVNQYSNWRDSNHPDPVEFERAATSILTDAHQDIAAAMISNMSKKRAERESREKAFAEPKHGHPTPTGRAGAVVHKKIAVPKDQSQSQ